jgi:prolyl-tRNA synthetase
VTGDAATPDEIQANLLPRAQAHRPAHTRVVDSKDDFYAWFTPEGGASADSERDPIHGGFALSHWSGDPEIEKKLKADLSVTLRCIPLDDEHGGAGTCPFTGKPSKQRVVWAKSY